MPQAEARDEAIRRAKARLCELLDGGSESLEERCSRLGLGRPDSGLIEFSAFGSPALLDLATLGLRGKGGADLPQADRILIYHYLACESALSPGGDPISFRDFPGGAFYWEPFRSRTALPLARRFGGDIARGDLIEPLALQQGEKAFADGPLGSLHAQIHIGFARSGGGLFLHRNLVCGFCRLYRYKTKQ